MTSALTATEAWAFGGDVGELGELGAGAVSRAHSLGSRGAHCPNDEADGCPDDEDDKAVDTVKVPTLPLVFPFSTLPSFPAPGPAMAPVAAPVAAPRAVGSAWGSSPSNARSSALATLASASNCQ